MTVRAVTMTGSIMAVLFFLFIMSRAMILEQVPRDLAQALLTISENKYVLLLLINLLLLLIGMIVDDISGPVCWPRSSSCQSSTSWALIRSTLLPVVGVKPGPRQRITTVCTDALYGRWGK